MTRGKESSLEVFKKYHRDHGPGVSKNFKPIVSCFGFNVKLIKRMPQFTSLREGDSISVYASRTADLSFGAFVGATWLCIALDEGHASVWFIEGDLYHERDGELGEPYRCTAQKVCMKVPWTQVHILHLVNARTVKDAYAISFESTTRTAEQIAALNVFVVMKMEPETSLEEVQMCGLLSCPWQYHVWKADCLEYAKAFVFLYIGWNSPPDKEYELLTLAEHASIKTLTLDNFYDKTIRHNPTLRPTAQTVYGKTMSEGAVVICLAGIVLVVLVAGSVMLGLYITFKLGFLNGTTLQACPNTIP